MCHQLPASAARWPLIRALLSRGLRRPLAEARGTGLDEESIEASYRDTLLAGTKEEAL
jgi:hypothetical protein